MAESIGEITMLREDIAVHIIHAPRGLNGDTLSGLLVAGFETHGTVKIITTTRINALIFNAQVTFCTIKIIETVVEHTNIRCIIATNRAETIRVVLAWNIAETIRIHSTLQFWKPRV
jgi:hypothetical protein